MAKKPLFKIDPGSEVTASGTGYIYVTTTPNYPKAKKMPDHDKPYVYKHVIVMVNHLGKLIDMDKFEVHHKDENPKNNKLSNLELKTRGEHSRGHAMKNKFWKHSPRTKPGKRTAMALQIVSRYLSNI